jgi:hypothetical protein
VEALKTYPPIKAGDQVQVELNAINLGAKVPTDAKGGSDVEVKEPEAKRAKVGCMESE